MFQNLHWDVFFLNKTCGLKGDMRFLAHWWCLPTVFDQSVGVWTKKDLRNVLPKKVLHGFLVFWMCMHHFAFFPKPLTLPNSGLDGLITELQVTRDHFQLCWFSTSVWSKGKGEEWWIAEPGSGKSGCLRWRPIFVYSWGKSRRSWVTAAERKVKA